MFTLSVFYDCNVPLNCNTPIYYITEANALYLLLLNNTYPKLAYSDSGFGCVAGLIVGLMTSAFLVLMIIAIVIFRKHRK